MIREEGSGVNFYLTITPLPPQPQQVPRRSGEAQPGGNPPRSRITSCWVHTCHTSRLKFCEDLVAHASCLQPRTSSSGSQTSALPVTDP